MQVTLNANACSNRYFSESPHIAGSVREKTLADELKKTWDKYGFDTVEMPRYKVLISLPRTSSPNKVQLIDNTDKVIFTAKEDVVVSYESAFIGLYDCSCCHYFHRHRHRHHHHHYYRCRNHHHSHTLLIQLPHYHLRYQYHYYYYYHYNYIGIAISINIIVRQIHAKF